MAPEWRETVDVGRVTARWRRAWTPAALALVALVLLGAGVSFYHRATRRGTDYNVFYLAGQLVAERPLDLYRVQAARGETYTYIYPPFFAVVMRPLAAVPFEVSTVAWFVVNAAATLHAAWILSRNLSPPGLAGSFLVWTLLLSLGFTVENIFLGQVHALILYLMVLAWDRLRTGRAVGAAGFLAAATAIKLIPGVFAVYFLARRQWMALLAFIVFLGAFTAAVPAVLVGPRATVRLLDEFVGMQVAPYLSLERYQSPIYDRTAFRKTLHDQDLGALLMRHLTAAHALGPYHRLNLAQWDARAVRTAMYIVFALMLGVSAAATWSGGPGGGSRAAAIDLEFAVYTVLSVLLSPRNRVAYWTVVMIPWAVLVSRLLDASTPASIRRIATWTLAASAALLYLTFLRPLSAMTVGFWGLFVLWVGLLAVARADRRRSPLELETG